MPESTDPIVLQTDGHNRQVDVPATAKSVVASVLAGNKDSQPTVPGSQPPGVVETPTQSGMSPPVEPGGPPAVLAEPDRPAEPHWLHGKGEITVDPSVPAPEPGALPQPESQGEPPQATPEDAQAIADQAGVPLSEVVTALAEMGVGIDVSGVPAELQDQFVRVLETTRSALTPVMHEVQEARDAKIRVQNFEQRVREHPESVLLTLWAAAPDTFGKVVEQVQRAADDPDYANMLRREVALSARETATAAAETSIQTERAMAKGQYADALTKAAADRHGVDRTLADQHISGAIARVGPNFDLASIDALIASLAPKPAPAPAPPVHATAKVVQAAQAAPQVPATSVPSLPQPEAPGASSGLDGDAPMPGRGGLFKSLIRTAARRADSMRREG